MRNQARALRNLPTLEPGRSGARAQLRRTPTDHTRPTTTDSVDLRLHARGPRRQPVPVPWLRQPARLPTNKLGAVQLLGPLSKLLQKTPLNFTSFNLNTMQATFEIAQNELRISKLQIDGPQTQIKAKGTMQLKDQALDMRVRVNLFANLGNPDSALRKVSWCLQPSAQEPAGIRPERHPSKAKIALPIRPAQPNPRAIANNSAAAHASGIAFSQPARLVA